MAQVYSPAEDSYLFSDFLKKYLQDQEGEIEYLDMGTGSGILSKTASEFMSKDKILAADINPQSIEILKKEGFNTILSNLFSEIKDKFDLITFNAPYLPRDSREPEDSALATTGGQKGDEISVEFLKQAKEHLNPNGKIFLLISSLTPRDKIDQYLPKEVAKMKVFMEDLIILEIN